MADEDIDIRVSLRDELSRPAERVEEALEDIGKEARQAGTQLSFFEEKVDDAGDEAAEATGQFRLFGKSIEDSREEARKSNKVFDSYGRQIDDTRKSVKDLHEEQAKLREETDKTRKSVDDLDKSTSRASRGGIFKFLKKMKAFSALKWATMIDGATFLATGINGIAAAAVAAVGPVSKLSGTLIAYPGFLLAAVQGVKTFTLGVKGMGEAFEALGDPESTIKEINAAMKELHPNAQKVVRTIFDFKDRWEDLQQSVQGRLWKGLSDDIRKLGNNYLPVLRRNLGNTADALNEVMGHTSNWLNQKDSIRAINRVMERNAIIVGDLGTGLSDWGKIFIDVLDAAGPMLTTMAGDFRDFSADVRSLVGDNKSDLRKFFNESYRSAKKWFDVIKDFGVGIFNIVKGSEPLSKAIGKDLTNIGKDFRRWTEEHPGQINRFFESMIPVVRELGRWIRDLGAMWFRSAMDPKQFTNFSRRARTELLPAIERIVRAMGGKFLDALISVAEAIAELAEAGLLDSVTTLLHGVAGAAKTAANAFEKLPDPLQEIVGILSAAFLARGLLRRGGPGGFLPFGGRRRGGDGGGGVRRRPGSVDGGDTGRTRGRFSGRAGGVAGLAAMLGIGALTGGDGSSPGSSAAGGALTGGMIGAEVGGPWGALMGAALGGAVGFENAQQHIRTGFDHLEKSLKMEKGFGAVGPTFEEIDERLSNLIRSNPGKAFRIIQNASDAAGMTVQEFTDELPNTNDWLKKLGDAGKLPLMRLRGMDDEFLELAKRNPSKTFKTLKSISERLGIPMGELMNTYLPKTAKQFREIGGAAKAASGRTQDVFGVSDNLVYLLRNGLIPSAAEMSEQYNLGGNKATKLYNAITRAAEGGRKQTRQLVNTATQLGLTRDETQALIEKYANVPVDITTAAVFKKREAERDMQRWVDFFNTKASGLQDESVQVKLSAAAQKVWKHVISAKEAGGSAFGPGEGAGSVHIRGGTYAKGGPITGGTPGKDSVHIAAMPNEHMWTVDEVEKAGGHQAMYALRSMAKSGMLKDLLPAYKEGGPVYPVGFGANVEEHNTDKAFGTIGDMMESAGNKIESMFNEYLSARILAMVSGGGLTPQQAQRGLQFAMRQRGKPYDWGAAGPGGYDCSGFMAAIYNAARGVNPYQHSFSTAGMAAFPAIQPGTGAFTVGWTTNYDGSGVGHTAGTINGMNVESRGGEGVVLGRSARGYKDRGFDHIGHLTTKAGRRYGGGDAAMFPTGSLSPFEQYIIGKESDGRVTANNPGSTAFGIGQLLEANRIAAARALGFNWRIERGQTGTTNYAQQLAMMRWYMEDRYGGPAGAYRFHMAHGVYDEGGELPPGLTLALNKTREPEHVVSHDDWRAMEASSNAAETLQGALQTVNSTMVAGAGPSPSESHTEPVEEHYHLHMGDIHPKSAFDVDKAMRDAFTRMQREKRERQ
jgi:NlpC/P60 family